MYSILLDSSDRYLALGIVKDQKLIDFIQYEAWQRQSEMMVSELQKLMNRNHIHNNDITSLVCGIGPGSYTGLRIAMTIAKIMATALNIPLYPVSSLQILKNDQLPSICVINARSGRSYVGVYENEKVILQDCIMTNESLLSYINDHPTYQVCGDVSYLNIEGKKVNILSQMAELMPYLKPCENILGLTPIYMKD